MQRDSIFKQELLCYVRFRTAIKKNNCFSNMNENSKKQK